jgi:DNA-binding MarR family transcriptional regulator
VERRQTQLSPSDCLGIERSCLALNLRRAERIIGRIYDTALKPAGIKCTQFSLLVAIRAMQPATLSRIADHLDMDRTTLTRNLDVLVGAGLAAAGRGDDLRERVVTITGQGDAALAAALPLWNTAQDRLTSRAGKRSIASLIEGLREVTAQAA